VVFTLFREVITLSARPGLPGFDYVRASAPDEVVRLLDAHRESARLLMGGTDLLVRIRDSALRPKVVIDVKHLPGMQEVTYDGSSGLTVGAAVTMNQVARHPAVLAHYPLLAEAARSVASYQLRNRATVGGNLCNASPAADLAPATLALEAQIIVRGPDGQRTVAASDFFLGPGRTVAGPTEFMTAIHYPAPPAGCAGTYLKLGRNRIGDLALVSVAVLGYPAGGAPSGFQFRIALGAVAPVPLRALDAERVLAAQAPGETSFHLAAGKAVEAASPIDDVRSSAAYRLAMVRNLTLRGLRDVWHKLGN
jgi:CO/xanthine dehydrogenase FAD-binding subunit